jgi:hypothetical protein
MFDTIILLSGPAEQSAFPPVLLAHNPGLTIRLVPGPADLEALDSNLLSRSRLIAFVTPVIVPATLYHRETEFGATAHVMTERVDAGPIIDVAHFPVPAGISVLGLEGVAYAHLAQMFWRMAPSLATDPAPPPTLPLQWSSKKYSRRAYRALCDIPLDIPSDELKRRIEVFGGNHFGMSPTIKLHGIEFRAVTSGQNAA